MKSVIVILVIHCSKSSNRWSVARSKEWRHLTAVCERGLKMMSQKSLAIPPKICLFLCPVPLSAL